MTERDALDEFVERMSDNERVVIVGMPAEETPLTEGTTSSGYNVDQAAKGVTMPYHVGKSAECPDGKPHAVIKNSDGKVMGCHASAEDAQRQIAAIHASEGAAVETLDLAVNSPAVTGDTGAYDLNAGAPGTPWTGVLAVEGLPTGDGRQFALNSITWADTPLPLRWNVEDSHGGNPTTKAVLVGRIDAVWRDATDPSKIMGSGVFDDNGQYGREALRLVQGKFLKGISVDPDDISDADVEMVFPESSGDEMMDLFANPELTIFHAGRLRAATLVDIPAFVEAQIWLADSPMITGEAMPMPGMTVDAGHFGLLSERPWNGAAHEMRLRGATLGQLRKAFAFVGGPGTAASARFLHHEVDGDVSVANLAACAAGIRAINAGRAKALTDGERRKAYDHMAQHLRSAGLMPPPYESGDVIIASGFEHLERPPRAWFDDPKLSTVTPLTITDEGRVFGHGAAWGSCHTGFAGECRTPPVEGEHSYFRLGEVVCSDGSRVAVGHITLGTGHAPLRSITSSQAAEHYDNTGTVVAIVASGEDEHGIWVAGSVRPDATEARVQALRGAPLSGDWRRIGGQLRLVAFLAVNRPGFPVPRLGTYVSQGKQVSLVAAGIVTQDMRRVTRDDVGTRAALVRIARSIGRDPETRLAELRTRVKGS